MYESFWMRGLLIKFFSLFLLHALNAKKLEDEVVLKESLVRCYGVTPTKQADNAHELGTRYTHACDPHGWVMLHKDDCAAMVRGANPAVHMAFANEPCPDDLKSKDCNVDKKILQKAMDRARAEMVAKAKKKPRMLYKGEEFKKPNLNKRPFMDAY